MNFRKVAMAPFQILVGLWEFVFEFDFRAYIPDWLLRLTLWAFPNAVAGEEPKDQLEGVLIVMGWGIFASIIGPWGTAFWMLLWSPFLFIALFRLSDVGNSIWKDATGSLPGLSGDGSYSTRKR